MQDRKLDFTNNRRILLTDLLVTGTCYYRTLESPAKNNVDLKALNPLHTFLDRNFNSKFHKNSNPPKILPVNLQPLLYKMNDVNVANKRNR